MFQSQRTLQGVLVRVLLAALVAGTTLYQGCLCWILPNLPGCSGLMERP